VFLCIINEMILRKISSCIHFSKIDKDEGRKTVQTGRKCHTSRRNKLEHTDKNKGRVWEDTHEDGYTQTISYDRCLCVHRL
jgi:hypothetical protein